MKKFILLCAISFTAISLAHADKALVVAQAPVITGGHATATKDKVNVRARASKGDWLRITLPAHAKCYVASKFIKDGAITGDAINVRSGAGTNFKDVGKLAKGEKVEVVEAKGEWTQIKPTAQCTGWVAAEFVEIAVPTPVPAPIQTTEIVTPPVSLPAVVSAPVKPAAPSVQVETHYIVKDGYIASVKESPSSYALMTENVGGRQYIMAYLDAPQMNLARYDGKHVRILGNQRWKSDERYPVIAIERLDMVW
jgi:uncharacterized protein YraI